MFSAYDESYQRVILHFISKFIQRIAVGCYTNFYRFHSKNIKIDVSTILVVIAVLYRFKHRDYGTRFVEQYQINTNQNKIITDEVYDDLEVRIYKSENLISR